jgi:hypothetical protein
MVGIFQILKDLFLKEKNEIKINNILYKERQKLKNYSLVTAKK